MSHTVIELVKIDSQEFSRLRQPWRDLLARSDADPLFCSWEWQYSWWQTWGDKLGLELYILAVKQQDRLLAVLPLFQDVYSPTPLLNVRRLQFIGNHWRSNNTVRSEYLGPIVDVKYSDYALPLIYQSLFESDDWDELLICDQRQQPSLGVEFGKKLLRLGCRKYTWKKDRSYYVDVKGSFDHYLSQLGKNSRLKLFNRRKVSKQLTVSSKVCRSQEDRLKFFSKLNNFHEVRWQKMCFESSSLDFHLQLLNYIKDSDCPIIEQLSSLGDGGCTVSVLYNVVAAGRLYNIQNGYIERYDKRLSLGTLHLGYEIEHAYSNKSVVEFDLLAGHGKKSNYKQSLSTGFVDVHTISYVRKLNFKMAIYFYQLVPEFVASKIIRLVKWISRAKC